MSTAGNPSCSESMPALAQASFQERQILTSTPPKSKQTTFIGGVFTGCGSSPGCIASLSFLESSFAKESAEESCTRSSHHVADRFQSVVEPAIVGDLVERTARTGLGVSCAVDDSSDSGVDHRSGAHRAGFERDRHRATLESPFSNTASGLSKGDDLRMPGGIRGVFAVVGGFGEDPSFAIDHGTDRNLSRRSSPCSELDRSFHHLEIECLELRLFTSEIVQRRQSAVHPASVVSA